MPALLKQHVEWTTNKNNERIFRFHISVSHNITKLSICLTFWRLLPFKRHSFTVIFSSTWKRAHSRDLTDISRYSFCLWRRFKVILRLIKNVASIDILLSRCVKNNGCSNNYFIQCGNYLFHNIHNCVVECVGAKPSTSLFCFNYVTFDALNVEFMDNNW